MIYTSVDSITQYGRNFSWNNKTFLVQSKKDRYKKKTKKYNQEKYTDHQISLVYLSA